MLANGSIPVTSLARDAAAHPGARAARHGALVDAGLLQKLKVNGRGLAAADFDNDGRIDVAINTIGGQLLLLRNTGPAGHWLDVRLSRFAPGALVTATLPAAGADARGAGRLELSLIGGPARPLRPRHRDLGRRADRALSRRADGAAPERPGRPDRHGRAARLSRPR